MAELWVVIGLVVAVGVVLMVREFMRPQRAWFVGQVHSELARVTEDRRITLRELADLDAAHAAGKVTAQDHAQRRAEVLARAEELTNQLDKLSAEMREKRASVERELAKLDAK